MQIISILIAAAILTGCQTSPDSTQAYIDFIDEYGSNDRYYCDESTGFLMHAYIEDDMDAPITILVTNASKDPVECPMPEATL